MTITAILSYTFNSELKPCLMWTIPPHPETLHEYSHLQGVSLLSLPARLSLREGTKTHKVTYRKSNCIWQITIETGLELHSQENQVSHYNRFVLVSQILPESHYSRLHLASPWAQLVLGGPAEQNSQNTLQAETILSQHTVQARLTGIPSFPENPGTPVIPCGETRITHYTQGTVTARIFNK